MIKKTVTYKDYNDNTRTEDLYFNLDEAEIAEMEMSISGGLVERIKHIMSAQDMPAMSELFKELILKSYGEKSADGKYFNKSPEISYAFSRTRAYSNLYMEIITDSLKAAEFFNGIVPNKKGPNLTPEQIVEMAKSGQFPSIPATN